MKLRDRTFLALENAPSPMWAGEIAGAIGVSFDKLENIRAAINALVEEGLVSKETRGARVYYSVNRSAPMPHDFGTHPRGSSENPIHTEKPLNEMEWPDEFKDRPYIYAVPPGGSVTKWYRSYADYCD